jgi:hypothetical protein
MKKSAREQDVIGPESKSNGTSPLVDASSLNRW